MNSLIIEDITCFIVACTVLYCLQICFKTCIFSNASLWHCIKFHREPLRYRQALNVMYLNKMVLKIYFKWKKY